MKYFLKVYTQIMKAGVANERAEQMSFCLQIELGRIQAQRCHTVPTSGIAGNENKFEKKMIEIKLVLALSRPT